MRFFVVGIEKETHSTEQPIASCMDLRYVAFKSFVRLAGKLAEGVQV